MKNNCNDSFYESAGSTTYFPSAISLMRVAGAKTAVVFSENAAFTK
jgi:hypothetical protein